jgi:formylglycine-generating enzyme required for sulfatase activity
MTRIVKFPRAALAAAIGAGAALALAGCGGGGGFGGSGSGGLLQNVSIVTSQYLVVDLTTGAIEARQDVPDLTTNAASAYRRTKMVFRAIAAGGGVVGAAPGSFAGAGDPAQKPVVLGKYYIGVFEVTQAQWQLMTASAPWTKVNPASVVKDGINQDGPAYNLSADAISAGLATADARLGVNLALPTDVQWEYAARGGTAGTFPWGGDHSDQTAGTYAKVAETAAGHVGPVTVGSLAPNAFGLYDTAGNVWELTSGGELRGGSWSDPLTAARPANKVPIAHGTAYALAGMRLVLSP